VARLTPTGFLPFALPDYGEGEIAEVVDTLRSGWTTTGPKARAFETNFAAFLGAPVEALAVNSATAGLHLALEALGVGPGDEVITTTFTFTATAEVVRYLGADPVLVDVDPTTLCLDIGEVARRITPRTKVILPVHYGGRSADITALLELARPRGIAVVEDAAHALPSTHRGRHVGTHGTDATVFSFYANKTLSTGEGGMIVTPRADIADRCRTMRLHGINYDSFARYLSSTPAWRYEIVAPGFKYNLTDIAAALGLHQLRRVEEMRIRRETISAQYDSAFADLPCTLPPRAEPGDVHAWHLYALQIAEDAPISRDVFIEKMFEHGIGCSVHYIPLHRHKYWRDTYGLLPEQFPNAERVFRGIVSLPIFSRMSDGNAARVISTVRELLQGA
jgi:dTDP-4-amino-4,6-dideoxygalactose transaminase